MWFYCSTGRRRAQEVFGLYTERMLAGGARVLPFYEQLAGDEVENHGDEGGDDLGEHAVPGELVNHHEE